MWYCVKRPSGSAPPCDELNVALRFAPPAETQARGVLIGNLENIRVASARAACPPPRYISSSFLAGRDAAEKSLAAAIDSLELKTSGEVAYKTLLMAGFFCGFVLSEKGESTPKMECSKSPSQIDFCYEAKVTLDMMWLDRMDGLKQLYSALPRSRVMSLHSACETPAFLSGGKPS